MKSDFILKRAYTQGFAVFIAVIASSFFSFSEGYWVAIAAFLVVPTQVGVNVRQGLQKYLFLLMTVILGTVISHFVPINFRSLLGVVLFCASVFFGIEFCIFAEIFFIILMLPVSSFEVLPFRVYAVTMGAIIGILCNLVIFPVRADIEFRNNLIPILNLYSLYLTAIADLIIKKPQSNERVENIKIQLEKTLQTNSVFFPAWVYAAGLSPTLQPGHRHFLIMIERLAEILTSLSMIARASLPVEFINSLQPSLNQFVTEASNIMRALVVVLTLNKLQEPVSDLKEEWINIETKINELIPPTFDMTDSDQEYFLLIGLLEALKDLRMTLINLGNSLQTACAIQTE